jgi:hypothetical protein
MAPKKPAKPVPEHPLSPQATFKPAADLCVSPFRTASDLMKEETSYSENERRIQRWAELMIRNKKVAPGWKDDRDATNIVRWISDRNAATPDAARPKKGKSKAGEE